MIILTVIGARPQFIKAATVTRSIREHNKTISGETIHEIIVHTGQHFDANMSEVFFDQLEIPQPDHHLGIAGISHGAMTGRMLEGIETLIRQEHPDWVLVYGDTNSTLAGALAAAKLQVSVAHVEAGLRSGNPDMPEEINRVLTDRVSTLLLCPTQTAVANLSNEGFPFQAPGRRVQRIEQVGDVMFDAVKFYRDRVLKQVNLAAWNLEPHGYALCTLHRQENTDDPKRLSRLLSALREIAREIPVVLPLHPRTRKKLEQQDTETSVEGLNLIEPLPYLEMQRLLISAQLVLTDSGGIQKEAYFHAIPCITLRDETEWLETVELGWNHLVGADPEKILAAFRNIDRPATGRELPYGDGKAAVKIVNQLWNDT